MKKILLTTSLLLPLLSYAQTKFIPTNGEIYIIKHPTINNTNSVLYKYNILTNVETSIGQVLDNNNLGLDIRGIAMNPKDSFIYGVVYNSNRIVRIDANASSTDVTLTNPTQLTVDNYQSADCDTAGNLFLYKVNGTTIPKINLSTRTLTSNIQTQSKSNEDFVVNRAGSKMYLKRQVLTEMSEYTLNTTGNNTDRTINIAHTANQNYLMVMDNLDNIYTINTSNYTIKALGMGTYDVVTNISTTSQTPIINGDAAYFRIPLYLEPIPCDNYLYQVLYTDGASTPGSFLVKFNPFTNVRDTLGVTGTYKVNAAGYYQNTQLIYAFDGDRNTFIAIGDSAKYIGFKLPTNPNQPLNSGDIDDNGKYYLRNSSITSGQTNYHCYDMDPDSDTYLELVDPTANFNPITSFKRNASTANADFAIHPTNQKQYGIYHINNVGYLNVYDPITNVFTNHALTGSLATNSSQFGGAFFDAEANLYVFENSTGLFHRININTYVSIRISNAGTPNGGNDGISCSASSGQKTDLGDAPDTYKTLLNSQGPLHTIDSNLAIGLVVDHEEDAVPDSLANTDNDDAFLTKQNIEFLNNGYQLSFPITNTTGSIAHIAGWIDFDGNGVFDSTERATATANASGNVTLSWSTFTYVKPENTYLRLRIALDADEILLPTGSASIGEVEDHVVFLVEPLPISFYVFDAVRVSNDSAKLTWEFNNAEQTVSHEIEYSANGYDFATIKKHNNINANQLHSYVPVYTGNNFFRIKVTERNGDISYSIIRKIVVEHTKSVIIKPNPAKDFIQIEQKDFTYNTYIIYNQIGVKQLSGNLNNSLTNHIAFQDLQPGVYMVVLANKFSRKTFTIIKN